MLISTFLLSDLKQLVTLVTTGDSQKYIYIWGKYGRQLNVIEFWGFFNWWHNWWQLVTLQQLLKTKGTTQEIAQNATLDMKKQLQKLISTAQTKGTTQEIAQNATLDSSN